MRLLIISCFVVCLVFGEAKQGGRGTFQSFGVKGGLVYKKGELEPYTGEMLISRPHNLTQVRKYSKGMRHGLWHLKNEQGVIISEIVYELNKLDQDASTGRLAKLFETNSHKYSKDPEIPALTAMELAQHHFHAQAYRKSLEYTVKAMRLVDSDNSIYRAALVQKGRTHNHLGKYHESETQLLRAVKLVKKAEGETSLNLVEPLREVANLYGNTGDQMNVLKHLIRIRRLHFHHNMRDSIESLRNRMEISATYRMIGDHEKALQSGFNVEKIIEQRFFTPLIIRNQNLRNLAQTLLLLERYDEALKYCQEESVGIAAAPPLNGFSGRHTLHSLEGDIYVAKGNFRAAKEQYRRGLEYYKENFGHEGSRVLSLTSKLAEVQIKLNQLDSASETLAGVDLNFELPVGHIAGIIHYCTTQHQLLLRYGKSAEARVWARRISEIHESKVAEIIGYGSERQRWASSTVKPVYGFLANCGEAEILAEHLLRTKGWVWASRKMDLLAAQSSGDTAFEALRHLRMKTVSELEQYYSYKRLQKHREQLGLEHESAGSSVGISSRLDKLDKQLHSMARQSPQWIDPLKARLDQLKRSLPEDSVLLEYVKYDHQNTDGGLQPKYGCLVITRNATVKWVTLGETSRIDRIMKQGAFDPIADNVFVGLMKKAYEAVLQPTQEHWPENTKRLLICADQGLGIHSFATMMDQNGHFTGENYELAYLHASSDLLLPGVDAKNKEAAIFADPDFGYRRPGLDVNYESSQKKISDDRLSPLPYTGSEAKSIQGILNSANYNVELYLGKTTTETVLRGIISPEILHIATHSIGADVSLSNDGERDFTAQPQRGLALAGAQHSMNLWEIGLGDKAQYDGILTSGELGNLNLSKTRLVTLSACSSGRGSSTHGQGISGMRQSLALAGVRNILMTHWPVSDRWTSEIMADFYRANLNVERPAEALHLVQKRWMKKFRLEEGAKIAAQIAGPFFITTQGSQ